MEPRIRIFRTNFKEGHPRNIVKLFQNLTSGFIEKDLLRISLYPSIIVQGTLIFKELLKKFHFVAMATRVFHVIKFCEQSLKRTFEETFLLGLVQIGPAVWEEKMFKEIVDDARLTTDTGPS